MRQTKTLLTLVIVCSSYIVKAQAISSDSISRLKKIVEQKQIFQLNTPDYKLSPLTGMTRKHWKEAGLYLLSGAFQYIHKPGDPMKFPRQPGKSYPRNPGQVPVEKLEGLCRTMFIAGPLLKEHPGLELNGIKLGDYYRYQLSRLLDPQSDTYIAPRAKNGGPSQTLVEFGGLATSLLTSPEVFWDPLSSNVKEKLAETMLSYGDGPTIGMNWRYFNIMILSFYKSRGYKVNEELLKELLEKSLGQYDGQGWYNDSPYYDYYSMWAFQMYGKIWSEYFGKKYYPEYAARLEKNFDDLQENYPYLFSRKGEMIMWGRSISYRMGAAAPFPLMGFSNHPDINYGWIRRIASGAILQFLENPDLLQDGIPTLGFYGAFEPAVQSYSCRGSVFWLGKLFLGLLVPKQSSFWTSVENEGPWREELQEGKVYNKYINKSNLLVTNYPGIGASEIRAWCFSKTVGVYQGTENYTRLSYNSAFPWQADGKDREVSMAYVYEGEQHNWEALRMYTFKKYLDGVYYRDAVFASNANVKLNLSEITLPNGILRIDRNISSVAGRIRLGHYSLPVVSRRIKERTLKVKGYKVRIVDNGIYQLALVPLIGWDKAETVCSKGLNPVSDESVVIDVEDKFDPSSEKDKIYGTLMLWKKSGEKWRKDDLVPVSNINYRKGSGNVEVSFVNGQKKSIEF